MLQKMLITKDMEVRNGINCIEPLLNNNTERIEAVFLPCNFQDEQKWKFVEKAGDLNNDDTINGMLINVASGKCLTFANTEKRDTKESMKKSKMLSMLAKLVRDSVDKVQSPYLLTCDKSTTSNISQSQVWFLD